MTLPGRIYHIIGWLYYLVNSSQTENSIILSTFDNLKIFHWKLRTMLTGNSVIMQISFIAQKNSLQQQDDSLCSFCDNFSLCEDDWNSCFLYPFSLFRLYPEMQNLFPEFRGQGNVDVLEETKFLNGHSRRLMTAVENSINSLNDFQSCSTYLQELGRRHKSRKLKPHYLEVKR